MGFFSSFKKFFTGEDSPAPVQEKPAEEAAVEQAPEGAPETAEAAAEGAASATAPETGEASAEEGAAEPATGDTSAEEGISTSEVAEEAGAEAPACTPDVEVAAAEPETESAAGTEPVTAEEAGVTENVEAVVTVAAPESADDDGVVTLTELVLEPVETPTESAAAPGVVAQADVEAPVKAVPETETPAESKSSPEAQPETASEVESVPEAPVETTPAPKAAVAAEAQAESVPEALVEAGITAGTDSESQAEAEARTEPASEAAAEAGTMAGTDSESQTEAETRTESAPEATAEVETMAEAAPEARPETTAEVEPSSVEQSEAEVQAESAPEAPAEAEASAEIDSESQPETEVQTEPDPEAQPDAETTAESAPAAQPAPADQAVPVQQGGFMATLKRWFGGGAPEPQRSAASASETEPEPAAEPVHGGLPAERPTTPGMAPFYQDLTTRLREADRRLSVWLDIVLDGVTEAGPELNARISFLLRSLSAPQDEVEAFVSDFDRWLSKMEYRWLDEFRSELQYRLSLALEMEDEEDERNRLFLKLSDSLSRTRAQFSRHFDSLLSSHGELDDAFWEELEELFIMADLGVDASMELVRRLRERAREEKVTTTDGARDLLREEIRSIFVRPRHIVGVNPPEVVLMIGVNGAGKTTTIAKLAYRDKMQGKKVMIAAADTFRAAAIDQMRVWAERVGTLFHAKQPGSDPASVAYEAIDRALAEAVDVLYIDTAGRLQTKVDLMDELGKVRKVIARRHPGAPHRTVLVLDATTGQNALSQARLFKESAGVDELILTKLDGTAKGGVAIAVALQHQLPITYVGLGEKVEDLRPFSGDDYADALFSPRSA